jgi:hypothetical protein
MQAVLNPASDSPNAALRVTDQLTYSQTGASSTDNNRIIFVVNNLIGSSSFVALTDYSIELTARAESRSREFPMICEKGRIW